LTAKKVSADSGATLRTIRNLWPYMWPSDRPDLKIRVLWATLFLVIAKLVLVVVPYFFKYATDALNGKLDAPEFFPAWLLAPVMLVLACNGVSTSCATRCLRALASMLSGNSPFAPSSTCTSCRCGSIWNAGPAACPA